MVGVPMTEDIRKFKTKSVGPFTIRQAICLVLGIAVGALVGLIIPVSLTVKFYIAFIIALPIILSGFVQIDGMYFETLIVKVLYLKVLTPQKRKMVEKNEMHLAYGRLKKAKELKLAERMPEKQKKAYLSLLKDYEKGIIQPSKHPEYKIYK